MEKHKLIIGGIIILILGGVLAFYFGGVFEPAVDPIPVDPVDAIYPVDPVVDPVVDPIDPVVDPIDPVVEEIVAPKAILVGNISTMYLLAEVRQGYVATFDVYHKGELVGTATWERVEEGKTEAERARTVERIEERKTVTIKHDADLRVQQINIAVEGGVVITIPYFLLFNHEKHETTLLVGEMEWGRARQEPDAFERIDLQELEVGWRREFPTIEFTAIDPIITHPDPIIIEVIEKESVSVPAGTFDVLRVKFGDGRDTIYYHSITLEGRLVKIEKPDEDIVYKLRSYIAIEVMEEIDPVIDPVVEVEDVNTLIRKLGDEDLFVRVEAAGTLRRIGKPALEPLITALRDEDPLIRREVVGVLMGIRDPRAVEPLIATLKDEDILVQTGAAVALGGMGDPRAVEPLIVTLKNRDEDSAVRASAAGALGEIEDPRAIEPLIVALKNTDFLVRKWAAIALGRMGDPRAVEPLIIALKDEDSWIRLKAAQALGEIGDPRAVEPLIAALKDEDSFVRSAVAEALKKITGENFGEDHIKWQEWWKKN